MATADYAELRSVQPPSRDTLQDRVYRELRLAVMSGRFLPGRALSIRGVANALGTSPMPVREALRQLSAERALTILPNRSFGIAELSLERFQDLVNVRQQIEGYAVARAAERIKRADIDRLHALEEEMRNAQRLNDRETYVALNQKFHFLIYEASGSAILLPIIETLWLQSGPYLSYAFPEVSEHTAVDHHGPLLAALADRDEAAAVAALHEDIGDGGRQIMLSGILSGAVEPT